MCAICKNEPDDGGKATEFFVGLAQTRVVIDRGRRRRLLVGAAAFGVYHLSQTHLRLGWGTRIAGPEPQGWRPHQARGQAANLKPEKAFLCALSEPLSLSVVGPLLPPVRPLPLQTDQWLSLAN